jgi:hypothetical protein
MALYLVYGPKTEDDQKKTVRSALRPLEDDIDVMEMTMRQMNTIMMDDNDRLTLKRIARRAYARRPAVKEKAIKYAKDPKTIKRRKEYEAREDVKRRKRESRRRKTALIRTFRELNPELYAKIVSSALDEETEAGRTSNTE